MTLESLILEANVQGWAVTLRQHPDRKAYWECSLSRPTEQTANGIVREIAFAIGLNPCSALDLALNQAEVETLRPIGLPTTEPVIDLRALLGLKPACVLPTITRR